MKAAEDALFATGVEAEPLMERAGLGCAEAICQFFPKSGRATLFVGKGHNGGDALVAGRHLRKAGWQVETRLAGEIAELASLTQKKLAEFQAAPASEPCFGACAHVQVDGLLGIGAKGPLRGNLAPLAAGMNENRASGRAATAAIDIPSGLDGDTGEPYEGAVAADFTLTISHVKAGLLADSAIDHVGRLALIPLPEIVAGEGDDSRQTLHAPGLAPKFAPPAFSTHKGQAGRVAVIAGSPGFAGAAVLCALGALRAGGGLVTILCDPDVIPLIAAKAPPEVMVRPLGTEIDPDAIAIGPGLGSDPPAVVLEQIVNAPQPAIIDADALNALARDPAKLDAMPENRLLTPHPGEMSRLAPDLAGSRLEIAQTFVQRRPATLLFKGARTIIAAPNRPTAYNTTGNPGMASGGMGDVLTGVCAALAARGIELYNAACLGSWLMGRAAEILVWERGHAPEGISAAQVAGALPQAITSLRRQEF